VLFAGSAWDIFFYHPPYGMDAAASDFHLFTHLKQFSGVTHMGNNEVKMTKTGSLGWWRISTMQAYRNSSRDMTSA
jgi:hypothetical protein